MSIPADPPPRSPRRKPARRRPLRPEVERLENLQLLATFAVTSVANAGSGTLRQAILDANLSTAADLIVFNIPGAGPHTIRPSSPLPDIGGPVTIDGYTQSGSSPNTLAIGNDAVLRIELDGTVSGARGDIGLDILGGGSLVRGLVIRGFGNHGIRLASDDNVVEGNFIGTDITGTLARGNGGDGVSVVAGAERNRIGTNGDGVADPAERNVISANGFQGVAIFDTGTDNNVVAGNYIGTDKNGAAPLGNGIYGVAVGFGRGGAGPMFNRIGSNGDGVADTAERNVISANRGSGVAFFDAGAGRNTVAGNNIGTDAAGTARLGNVGAGVFIASASNTIGGTTAGARNIISGNGGNGISIAGAGATGNRVQGNFIGTDVTGRLDLGNARDGVAVREGASDNLIGGTTAGAGNLVSGNDLSGVTFLRTAAAGNQVQGNLIGTDVAGAGPLGNGAAGVFVETSRNLIGGSTVAARNVISANGAGIFVIGTAATNNVIQANFIGTDVMGTRALPNGDGIDLTEGASSNLIGTDGNGIADDAERNVISGNNRGVYIVNPGTERNVVAGNYMALPF